MPISIIIKIIRMSRDAIDKIIGESFQKKTRSGMIMKMMILHDASPCCDTNDSDPVDH